LDFKDSDHVKIFESAFRPHNKHDTKDKSKKCKVTFADGRKKLKVLMKAELAAMECHKQEEGWSSDSSA
jgi:hypothetical protein